MMKLKYFILSTFVLLVLYSCKKEEKTAKTEEIVVSVKTCLVEEGNVTDIIQLNAKTVFLKKNLVQSPISGYVYAVKVKYGDLVKKNNVLFVIQSKESKAMAGSDNENMGLIKVLANSDGYVAEVVVSETGGYVTEGAALCSIVENKNITVQANMPYEYKSSIKVGSKCQLSLPDNTTIEGTVTRILPTVDANNQTQQILISPKSNQQIPENLNITATFQKAKRNSCLMIPISALMSNEKQSEFWVMKIVDNDMAIRLPVDKGYSNETTVEIKGVGIQKGDMIITEGAYGMEDSTKVKIKKRPLTPEGE